MNKGKAILLVLALVLPVSVFLFLKFFGKNEFAVEPFYVNELPEGLHERCSFAYTLPYLVPEHILSGLSWSMEDSLTLFCFVEPHQKNLLKRISERYQQPQLKIVSVNSGDSAHFHPNIEDVMPPIDSLDVWKPCFLFIKGPNDLLLVDRQRRIRGSYQLDNRDEVDRLMVELSIILKLY